MIYDTKGEFIQALKDYDKYYEAALKWRSKYRDLHYLRYEKVKSSLDYDIVGYEDGEAIRQIKGRNTYNHQKALETQEKLDDELQKCLDEFTRYQNKMQNCMAELNSIKEPLKTILDMRYLKHQKLKEICKKSDLYLDEAGMYKYIMRGLDKYYENK